MRSTKSEIGATERDVRVDGIAVSAGAAVGRVLRLDHGDILSGLPPDFEASDVAAEIERLRRATDVARKQILDLKERVARELGRGHAYFFEAHLLMLEDRELLADIERVIRARRVKAEWAIKAVLDRMLLVYAHVKDDYLRERGSDIEDVAHRVVRALNGGHSTSLGGLQSDVVIVANTLPPSAVAELDLHRVLAFATGDGGFTSHTAIIARSLGIPAVVGLPDIALQVGSGDSMVVDGGEGCVIMNPTKSVIRRYMRKRASEPSVLDFADAPEEPRTLDGHLCVLRANVELVSELDAVARSGARGIGLFRSEFLYLNKLPDLPSEDEQTALYEQLLTVSSDGGVTIRSFDLGGDKLPIHGLDAERNPALGLRALRLALNEKPVFRTHLRAILRASAKGQIRVMFPMVAGVSDLLEARRALDECRSELRAEGRPYNPKMPVGIMIEVPSTVLIADQLAKECDFFSVGTNDLIQYLLAVDRSNQHVAHIYQPLHPAVLRSLKHVADAARNAGIPSIVCGEMSADPVHITLLIGLGYDRFSMAASAIPLITRVVRAVDRDQAQELATELLALRTPDEIERRLSDELPRRFPGFFAA